MDLNKLGLSTNFTAPLNDSRINQDNYEVALAQISFTNTETIDMGILNFTSYISPENTPTNTPIKFEAKMGDSYKNIFQKLNSAIENIYAKNEFERQKFLRSKNFIKDNDVYYQDINSGFNELIILPLKNDKKFDELVRGQINL